MQRVALAPYSVVTVAARHERPPDHIDGKLPNLALMKLAHWHKAQGHAADGGDVGHHQTPGAPHFSRAGAPVDVLPQDALVLLANADSVGNGEEVAPAVVEHTASK